MNRTRHSIALLVPGLVVAAIIMLVGIMVIGQVAFFGGAQGVQSDGSWLDWELTRIVVFTTWQAGLSCGLSLLVGLALAWALANQQVFFGRDILLGILASALVLPALVVVLGLVSVFGRAGWLNSVLASVSLPGISGALYGLPGILIGHVYFNGAFAARTLVQRFDAIPEEQLKLAKSLDLSPWQRFRYVEWPSVRSSLPGLGSVIFLLCFTSFAIVLTLGGSPAYNTLEVAIYEALKFEFDLSKATKLAVVQLIICTVIVVLGTRVGAFGVSTGGRVRAAYWSSWPDSMSVRALQRGIVVVFGLFFILPLAATLIDGLRADLGRVVMEAGFRRALMTSLGVGSISATLTLLCALAMAIARVTLTAPLRLGGDGDNPLGLLGRMGEGVLRVSGALYLAMPALVFAYGCFLWTLHWGLEGAIWPGFILVAANVLLSLPFALAILVPAYGKVAERYDKLALSLGLGLALRWRLEWPLLRSDIATVAGLSFCLSLGDLGVIALFGSQQFSTLPWYLLQKMGSYRTDDAAAVALVLLLLVLSVLTILPTLAKRADHGG